MTLVVIGAVLYATGSVAGSVVAGSAVASRAVLYVACFTYPPLGLSLALGAAESLPWPPEHKRHQIYCE